MKFNKFAVLPIILLLCGIAVSGLGIYEKATSETKGYAQTVGYYNYSTVAQKEHYDSQKNSTSATTYYLTYQYAVDGEAYYVTSDYTTSFEPSYGEEIKILYDKDNPEKAVIGGPSNRSNLLIIFGIFFILGSVPFLVLLFSKKEHKIDIMGLLMGLILAVAGYGALSVICGSFSPVGIFNYIGSSFKFPMIITFLMIFAGLFAAIKSVFFKAKEETDR